MHWIYAIVALAAPATVLAQASLDAPVQAIAGATVDVAWTGPGEDYDSIYILAPGEPDSASGIHSSNILRKNPLVINLPEQPGEFELRYVTRLNKRILTRRPRR